MRINVQSTSGGDSQIGDGLGVMSELGFLLINAVAIAIATYLASFRSLNISRALAKYDQRVQMVLAPTRPCEKYHKILVLIAVTLVEGSLAYYLFSAGDRVGQILTETILKGFFSLVAFKGFLSLIEFRASGLEVFRRPFHGIAIAKVHKVEDSSVRRGVLTALCGALALYSITYPNMFLESVAMLGVASCVIRNPTFFAPKPSIRGLTIGIAMVPAFAIVTSSLMVLVANHAKQSPPEWMNVWLLSVFQFWGIGAAGVLTALVLRYEHSISDPSNQPSPTVEKTSPAGSTRTVSVFTKEGAFMSRVRIAEESPEFPRPLFHTLLFLSFLVHVPTVGLALCAGTSARVWDCLPAWVRLGAGFMVIFPAQLWTAFTVPAAVGLACLMRADGARLWRYSEIWVQPALPAKELDKVTVVRDGQRVPEASAGKVPVDV